MDNKALYSIGYGLYVLSSGDGGCMVNAVCQQTSEPCVVSVTVNKQNHTHDQIVATERVCLSVLSESAPFELIKSFGFRSGKDVDKWKETAHSNTGSGLPYLSEHANAYISGKVKRRFDLGSHTMFLVEVDEAERLSGEPTLTYAYYQSNVKPKPAAAPKKGYRCRICGYFHEGETLPADFICPICKHGAADFEYVGESGQAAINNDNNKGEFTMKKFVCTICGYIHEGDEAPEFCPQCKAPKSKFVEQKSSAVTFADEHVVGVAQGVDEEIVEGLRQNFTGECTEVGMYLAMARVAFREGYPEIGMYWEKAAYEEAEHAAKFAELLGEVVSPSTKKNLEMRVNAESGACDGKKQLAAKAKQLNLDAIHDTVHEMAKDEARHGRAFEGLLNRYFK